MEDEVLSVLSRAIKSKITPGGVVGWISGDTKQIVASGRLTYEEESAEVTRDTVYDIASVTKAIPLSSLAHIALQEEKLQLDSKASEIIEELQGKHHELIEVKHLLNYTAVWDFPKGLSRYADDGVDAIKDAIFNTPLQAKPGSIYQYTNAPAVVLGMILEKVYDQKLDALAKEKLFMPLGMDSTSFDASEYESSLVAPTEIDSSGATIHKSVHDETARSLGTANIISGNAGVFSNAADLLKFCSMVLNGGAVEDGSVIFEPATIETFQQNALDIEGESAALGWELNQPRFMGKNSHSRMFGKTGFTGCVVLIDITKQRAMVLLSNAQYPKRHTVRESVNSLRRELADIIFG